ncbi:MAG: DUF3788 domain-containing protein [Bacteroidales bacterium]|jgi:hypothetical protein|nr:DUF3788 domain-containing protein [Bacteroidales bacterium]
MNEKPLLNEQAIFPSNEVLNAFLAESYPAFEQLSAILTNEHSLVLEWNYYNDGRCWLCKVLNRKKNLFWLSVCDKFFKITFYFIEKHLESFTALDISETLKEELYRAKPIGKLLPLLLEIRTREQFPDLLKIVEFKKKLKK